MTDAEPAATGRKVDCVVIGILCLAIGVLLARPYWTSDEAQPGPVAPESKPVVDIDRSVAVLPFSNLNEALDQQYFGAGLAEELINVLTRIPDLRVAARSASFGLGESAGVPQAAKVLHVAHVPQGSVRAAGNQTRVSVQLVRASDLSTLWSQTFENADDDPFAIQDDIARGVAARLQSVLYREVSLRHAKERTAIPAAYTAYLRALHPSKHRMGAAAGTRRRSGRAGS